MSHDPAPGRSYPQPLSLVDRDRDTGTEDDRPDCGHLPQTLGELVGRDGERGELRRRLREGTRLLTLTGPGGVGKTRLALAVAADVRADFGGDVAFVSLADVPQPVMVLPAIATALGVRELSDRPLLGTLAVALHDRHILLILDNLEHLPGAAPVLARLLAVCPGLSVLATSRAPLRIHGEQRFATLPLSLPPLAGDCAAVAASPAVALFVERARGVRHDFALTGENADQVAEICRRVDGLPLAIELAAAWVRVLPLPALVSGLEQRFSLLRGGPDDQPARLRTMRGAIRWSYDLLDVDQARLFHRLSIFVGGFTLEAAQWIDAVAPAEPGKGTATANPDATLNGLAALVDANLVQFVVNSRDDPRYRLLETVRGFAMERLEASGEAEAVAAAHAAHMLAFAERAEPMLLGSEEDQWQARCEQELGNVRAALGWSLQHDVDMALRMSAALLVYWFWIQLAEGRRWLSLVLDHPTATNPQLRMRALVTDAALALVEGSIPEARRRVQDALDLGVTGDEPVAAAMAHWVDGATGFYADGVDDLVPGLDAALDLFEHATTTTDRAWSAHARAHRALVAFQRGDEDLGLTLFDEALARAKEAGSRAIARFVHGEHADCRLARGDMDAAQTMLRDALDLSDQAPRWVAAGPLLGLAVVKASEGDAKTAARQIGAAEALMSQAGLDLPAPFRQRISRVRTIAAHTLAHDLFESARQEGREDPGAVIAAACASPNRHAAHGAVAGKSVADLTPREIDVLRRLIHGLTDKEIAAELGIGVRTVGTHVAAIRTKLGVPSRGAAIAIAVREHLIPD